MIQSLPHIFLITNLVFCFFSALNLRIFKFCNMQSVLLFLIQIKLYLCLFVGRKNLTKTQTIRCTSSVQKTKQSAHLCTIGYCKDLFPNGGVEVFTFFLPSFCSRRLVVQLCFEIVQNFSLTENCSPRQRNVVLPPFGNEQCTL